MAVKVNEETCIGCEACIGVCPVGALSLNENDKAICDENACIDCGACLSTCPTEAIS